MSAQSNSVNPIPEIGGRTLPVTTVGLAVPDIEVAMNFYWTAFGWGGWTIYRQEPPSLRDMRYRGEVSEFSFLVAGTSAPGGFSFWVCQPLSGTKPLSGSRRRRNPRPAFLDDLERDRGTRARR